MTKARLAFLLLLLVVAPLSSGLAQQEVAKAHPAHRQRMAGSFSFFQVNRVVCNVDSQGAFCAPICCDVADAGWWPKPSPQNRYMFSSGPQVAGIIGANGGPWAGDTTGAFFHDLKGTTQHGEAITQINSASTTGTLNWPEPARVPSGAAGALFDPTLHGRISASEGDVWWLSWDGNPGLVAGRPHPLGVVMEVRGLEWNVPGANEDIVYFIINFYNISSLNPADYVGAPGALQPILLEQARKFHLENNAEFGITLPTGGYTIENFYAGQAADMDVGEAGTNFTSVHTPLGLGFAWDWRFPALSFWNFDPLIFSSPFFAGTGLVGIKTLNPSPQGDPQGMSVYSQVGAGGVFPDPVNVEELYRYLAAHDILGPAAPACSFNPAASRICFIEIANARDVRQYQSTGPFTIPPGGSATMAIAYVFAAPLETNGIVACRTCIVSPGAGTIIAGMSDPAIVSAGVNPIDSIAGFLGASDASGDGMLQGDEFVAAPRSLYAKAQLAQAMFDHHFLVPSAPAAPGFFLIPGDGQVTVMWRPSATEQSGDPFFQLAKDASVLNDQGGLVVNPLYDPNFRQFDVEGYRIYRARISDPAAMTLLAQFDYAGTTIPDYAAQVNPTQFCAPEVGITAQCPIGYDPVIPGQPRVAHIDVPVVGLLPQVRLGDRIALPNGTALMLRADSLEGNGLSDNGVPFVFVDNTVRNSFRYFYTVVAFDVNSWQSGPASFESTRILKSVTPVKPASNFQNTVSFATHIVGRGVAMDTIITQDPTIDPVTGVFSGPARPANGLSVEFVGFVKEVIGATGNLSVRLDSITPGQADLVQCCGGVSPGIAANYYFTATSATDVTAINIPLVMNGNSASFGPERGSVVFDALAVDNALASRFGGSNDFKLKGVATHRVPSLHLAGGQPLGCRIRGGVTGAIPANECIYNGHRWFNGPTTPTSSPLPSDRILAETFPDPNGGNCQHFDGNSPVCSAISFNNGGSLAGVATIHVPQSYTQLIRRWRNVESVLGPVFRAADMNVYWGTGGLVDSVIDVTHNVVIPFRQTFGASWGILNADNPGASGSSDTRPTVLTANDFTCLDPINNLNPGIPITNPTLDAVNAYPCNTTVQLEQTARLGSVAFYKDAQANAVSAPVAGTGFLLYVAGTVTIFQAAALPPAGTVWTLRTYAGMVRGGQGIGGGSTGKPYTLITDFQHTRPMTAVGAEVQVVFDVVNQVNAPQSSDLTAVHTVPDPYYLRNDFEADAGSQMIKFVNLPEDAIIRIYSSSGVLVTLLEHHSTTFGSTADWNVRNRTGRRVSSGVYFYHVESGNARRVGRFTVVNDRPGF
jgi:hypothetical protein